MVRVKDTVRTCAEGERDFILAPWSALVSDTSSSAVGGSGDLALGGSTAER
jgi:hypothetical protein